MFLELFLFDEELVIGLRPKRVDVDTTQRHKLLHLQEKWPESHVATGYSSYVCHM